MAARSLEDQVAALLSRTLAEPRQVGVARPDLEAAAVFDSIALSLLLKPRAAVYFAFMARNGLLAAVRDELALIDQLSKDIQDTANPAFKITGSSTLRRAQVALLNMESLPRISGSSVPLDLFNQSVSEFLNSHLSKNVRRVGATELVRPSSEAAVDLQSTFETLKARHADVVDRFYTLAAGIENFETAPFNAIAGVTTVARARADLEDVLAAVEAGDPALARDIAIRLIASRSTVNTIATPPKWNDTLLQSGAVGSTARGPAVEIGSVTHPFTLPNGPLAVESAGQTLSFSLAPADAALVLSATASYPVTIPAGYWLFLTYTISGVSTTVRILMDGTFSNATGVANRIMAAGTAVHAVAVGTNRVLLYVQGASALAINPVYVLSRAETQALGVTTAELVTLETSAASYVGLTDGSVGTQEILAVDMVAMINLVMSPIVSASFTADGRIVITSNSDAQGSYVRVFGAVGQALGFSGTKVFAQASAFNLAGVQDHTELFQPGDVLTLPDGSTATIDSVESGQALLAGSAKTFSGPVRVDSVLALRYSLFISALKKFLLERWSTTPYVDDLETVDRALAPLVASQSPAQRNEALLAIDGLKTELTSLLNVLSDASTMLPDRAAMDERKMVDGILTTLTERHFTRAADLLMKADIQALLGMDEQTASYGGAFLKASGDLVRASVPLPDPDSADSSIVVRTR